MSVRTITTNETNTVESASTLSFPNSSESEFTYNTNPSMITSEVNSNLTLVFPSEDGSNSDHNFEVGNNNLFFIPRSAFDDYDSPNDLSSIAPKSRSVSRVENMVNNIISIASSRSGNKPSRSLEFFDEMQDVIDEYDELNLHNELVESKFGFDNLGTKIASNKMVSFDGYDFKVDSEDDKKRKKLLKLKTNTPFVHSGRMGMSDILNSHTFEDAVNIAKERKSIHETNIKFLNISNSKIDDNSTISSITLSSGLVSNVS